MKNRYMIKENYLLLIIIIGILSLCMYSSFALFSLEKTTTKDIVTMKSASDIQTTLKVFEYKQVKVSAGNNRSVMVNVSNDTGKSIYYGVFYEMVNPSTKSDDIGIYKIDWSTNPTVGTIGNEGDLSVELLIINNTSSEIIINIGVAGADSNELGLEEGKYIVTETFNTGKEPDGSSTTTKTTTVNYSYTGAVQTTTLKAGTHKLEVWGASGGTGHPSGNIGGKGGYSYGTLTLTEDTNVYIYVGQEGQKQVESSTFGGGGQAEASSTYNSGQGGGASDIRIKEDSLYSRVIVAGGGGGGAGANETTYAGGYGGGLTGGSASANNSGAKDTVSGATQTSAGSSTANNYDNSQLFGSFGTGGYYGGGGTRSGGAGGGGWYGGGAGSYGTAGSGGSGYVYTSSTASNYPSGGKLNSSYYLSNAATVAGNTSFTDNTGSTVTGHSGNGYARITSTINTDTTPSIDTSGVGIEKEPLVALKDLVTCEDNGAGCKIVLVKPATSESINDSVNAIYVLEDNNGNRYKYYKKVSIIKEKAASEIINLNQGDTWDSGAEGLYATNKYTDTDGTEKYHEYRYIGANPNNYVWFNNDMYRIIGVFDNYTHGKDGYLVKLISENIMGGYSWGIYHNSSGTYGNYNNKWAGNNNNGIKSNLNILLNEYFLRSSSATLSSCGAYTYYYQNAAYKTEDCTDILGYSIEDSNSMIETVTWHLYGPTTNLTKENIYTCERGTNTTSCAAAAYGASSTTAKIGLMYASDYLYASSYYKDNTTNTSLDYYFGNENWLFKGHEWTITPKGKDEESVWSVYTGSLSTLFTYIPYGWRPSFYLNSNIKISGGEGTFNDPYTLEEA